ncbi:MAG: ATP-dependent DNA helicase RecG [Acholeplasmataceae bacterium]
MEVRLDQIKGVGPKLYQSFKAQKIWSTYDLVLRRPKRYESFVIQSLEEAKDQETITIIGSIKTEPKLIKTAKVTMVSMTIDAGGHLLKMIAFNRPYLVNQLKIDHDYLIKGKYNRYQKQLVAQVISEKHQTDHIKPIYGFDGLYDSKVNDIIKTIFDETKVSIYETLPANLLSHYHLLPRYDAYYKLHLPKDSHDIHQAHRRLKYEEAFFLQLKLYDQHLSKKPRPKKAYDLASVKKRIHDIPYQLTGDQKKAVNDIFKDFQKEETSYRLLLGDVGSGKTMVSALAIYAVITAGQQVAFMAPTELLAKQHFNFFKAFLSDVSVGLLTSQTPEKKAFKSDILNKHYDLIIGTHALITDDVIFNHLGLVVIDEQHKFGVETRQLLIDKAREQDVLYLSATPIPRTLAMLYFNQADISEIREKPVSRKPIDTHYVTPKEKDKVFKMIQSTLDKKEHIYVVVPAITSTKTDDNIETVYQELSAQFDAPIFILHGQIKHSQHEHIMTDFKQSKGAILLSTTMIEVGIDIPTATLICIYSAEHFGLSQLHQLRGRVGRSHRLSTCVLISQKEDIGRLEMLTQTEDGFLLSAYDLEARGPGDFLGVDQSGYLNFSYLNLVTDQAILKAAYDDVKKLMSQADFFKNPKYKHLHQYLETQLKI